MSGHLNPPTRPLPKRPAPPPPPAAAFWIQVVVDLVVPPWMSTDDLPCVTRARAWQRDGLPVADLDFLAPVTSGEAMRELARFLPTRFRFNVLPTVVQP